MGYTYALSFIGDIYRTGPEELIDYAEAKRYYQKESTLTKSMQ